MKTWKEMVADKSGTTYRDWFEDGIRCLVVRGPSSLCAYLGVPEGHPLAGKSYDDIPLEVHGGLTFSNKGDGKYRPTGFWWYGWDYGHCGDYSFYDMFHHGISKKWTIEEVETEVKQALYEFKKLVKLAEDISNAKT